MSVSLDYESIDQGTPIEGISIPAMTRGALAQYAGAIDDYNPMHLDDKVAMAAGKASVFAPSSMVMAFVGRMVQAWFTGASLRRYGMRLQKLVWPGDVLTCRGVVIDKREENGECIIDADVWADNQRGETVAKGRVIAVVPRKKGKPLSRAEAAVGLVYRAPEAKTKTTAKKKSSGGRTAAKKKTTKKKR